MSTAWKSTKSANKTFTATVLSSRSRQQKIAMMGCLAILGLLLAVSACSKQSQRSALVAVSSPAPSPAPAAISVPSIPAPQFAQTTTAPQTAAKKISKKRPENVSFTDANSGVSFTYPRKFNLATAGNAQPQLDGDAVPMNFIQSGGTTVATVAMPKALYPGTDFASAFFSVNVNRSLSEEQCSHFAFVDTRNADGEPIDAEKAKIGTTDMEMTSEFAGNVTRQAEAQYYHSYENGACYEYILGLGTAGYPTIEGVEPVDRDEVFARLEKILATVKTHPVAQEQAADHAVTAAESAK
jgi:hypothetical protein